ncbi:hypothetical protein BGW36DRAFT_387098 [Talaromyces proteolyticus]|uniref:Xylanolytic transcriptional activator regulatory domain-containing protein n=1 Tax=Talaromyces proteolyticus TaxID=1131652 RepID=A0AAD4KLT7_9EURO|nr:uncharacterized protein BGW36DRAFT_387098 [Talaromyces proteolyticus]KAH8692151.1 hypothetical protein BGW36DRAFT_387098 [Talaromyces proteolyticus]
MLLQRQELSDFVRRLLRHISSSSSRRKQMISSSLKKKRPGKKNRASQIWEKEDLISLLPSRARADSLIQTYLDVFETTYRVFHVPNFLRRYNDFWKSPTDTDECFILHILLAMATVNAFVHDGPERNDEDRRKQAKKSIRAAESWLRVQSQKWVTLDIFQIHVTLFHAKKLNWVEFKSSWESIGTLVRLSMAAGLHRDPTYLSQKMPVFEAEMRRRLWYTILELELQEACDRGMQPMLSADNWDCMPPSNIHDEDIGEMTIDLPPERDLHEYTRTSFLCTAQKHLPLRLEVLNKSNSLKNGIDVDLARKYVETLQGLVEGLPNWPETPSSAVANVLSRLVLYEQLMILQQPFAISQDTGLDHHRSFYFRATQRQMAIDVMSLYSSLPRSEALQIFTIRGDSFRAVLAMCYEAVQSSGAMNSELYNHEAEIHLLEETMTLFADRVRTLHKGFQLYWLVSAAVGLVKVRYSKVPNDDLVAAETVLDAFTLLEQINQCTGTNNLDHNHGIDPRLNSIEVTGNMQEHQESHTISSAIDLFDPDTFFAGLVDMDFSPDWLLRFDDPYSCPTINDL